MSRRVARWVYALAAVILPAVLLLTLVVLLHTRAINFVYKNVDDISDGEMPPTITSFQSGPDVVSTIGGSGEGLNCSLPALTNMFFDPGKDAKGKRRCPLGAVALDLFGMTFAECTNSAASFCWAVAGMSCGVAGKSTPQNPGEGSLNSTST